MNQNDTLESLLHQYIGNSQNGMFTSMPARVVSSNNSQQMVDVQLLVNRANADDTYTQRPPVLSVPLMYPASRTSQFSFPIEVGDTVLVVFGMRNIDRFKAGSTNAHDPLTFRKYDRQDAMAIPGLFPFSDARNNPSKRTLDHSTDDAVITHNIGSGQENEVRLKANGDVIVNSPSQVQINCSTAEVNAEDSITANCTTAQVNASDSVLIDTPETTVTGNMTVQGMLTYVSGMTGSGGSSTAFLTGNVVVNGEVTANGVALSAHTHGGVDRGNDDTDSPN